MKNMNLCNHCEEKIKKRIRKLRKLKTDTDREFLIQQLFWMINMEYNMREPKINSHKGAK